MEANKPRDLPKWYNNNRKQSKNQIATKMLINYDAGTAMCFWHATSLSNGGAARKMLAPRASVSIKRASPYFGDGFDNTPS